MPRRGARRRRVVRLDSSLSSIQSQLATFVNFTALCQPLQLALRNDVHAQLTGAVQLRAGVVAGDEKAGRARDAAHDASAMSLDEGSQLLPAHLVCPGNDERTIGERA